PLRRPTMKAVLIAGFALVVGLWAYTGYEFTSRMAAVEDQSNKITARYLEAQESLTRIRSQLLVASVYVRDALLEPDDEVIARYEGQLEDTYLEIDRALGAYVPVLGTSAERDHVERLRREIDQFRQMTRDVLRRNANGNSNHTRTLLAQNLVPRREAALRVSEEVQALNRTAFVQHQRDIADVHRIAERRTWQQVGLAVLASLVIAWIFSFY